MKLGYARVSTEDQTLQLQGPRLKEAGCEKVFEEKISGAVRKRGVLFGRPKNMRPDQQQLAHELLKHG